MTKNHISIVVIQSLIFIQQMNLFQGMALSLGDKINATQKATPQKTVAAA